jgi:hypothetical protein
MNEKINLVSPIVIKVFLILFVFDSTYQLLLLLIRELEMIIANYYFRNHLTDIMNKEDIDLHGY